MGPAASTTRMPTHAMANPAGSRSGPRRSTVPPYASARPMLVVATPEKLATPTTKAPMKMQRCGQMKNVSPDRAVPRRVEEHARHDGQATDGGGGEEHGGKIPRHPALDPKRDGPTAESCLSSWCPAEPGSPDPQRRLRPRTGAGGRAVPRPVRVLIRARGARLKWPAVTPRLAEGIRSP